jgi:hypothetical protein
MPFSLDYRDQPLENAMIVLKGDLKAWQMSQQVKQHNSFRKSKTVLPELAL